MHLGGGPGCSKAKCDLIGGILKFRSKRNSIGSKWKYGFFGVFSSRASKFGHSWSDQNHEPPNSESSAGSY